MHEMACAAFCLEEAAGSEGNLSICFEREDVFFSS